MADLLDTITPTYDSLMYSKLPVWHLWQSLTKVTTHHPHQTYSFSPPYFAHFYLQAIYAIFSALKYINISTYLLVIFFLSQSKSVDKIINAVCPAAKDPHAKATK